MSWGSDCFACALTSAASMNGINTSATGTNINIVGTIASIKNGGSRTIMTPVIVNLNRFMRRVRLADLLMGERTFADSS
jgi:hypothetical protein